MALKLILLYWIPIDCILAFFPSLLFAFCVLVRSPFDLSFTVPLLASDPRSRCFICYWFLLIIFLDRLPLGFFLYCRGFILGWWFWSSVARLGVTPPHRGTSTNQALYKKWEFPPGVTLSVIYHVLLVTSAWLRWLGFVVFRADLIPYHLYF